VPGLRGKVSRPARIRVKALDRNGKPVELVLHDFDAVVTQHECDHLDGVLFIDRLDDTRQLSYTEEFERYWVKQEAEGGSDDR
jgi:peptide deformylase